MNTIDNLSIFLGLVVIAALFQAARIILYALFSRDYESNQILKSRLR